MDEAKLRSLVAKLTVADKARLLTGADFWSLPPMSQIGLRSLVFSDGPNGVRGTVWDERDTSLLLPVASALAATWDRAAARTVGELFGDEARRRGVHVVLAPTVNVHRSPFGGRHFENFSEDPLLIAEVGAEVVAGIQSRGVAATPKHYVANDSETERLSYDAVIDEQTLREVYLKPFERIIAKSSPWALMAAYNSVNGHTMTENSLLVNDILKGEWGWDGVLVSDWLATRSLRAAALGGLDLAMPGPKSPWSGGKLAEAVEQGEVPEEVLDDKVLRVLRLAARVGAFEDPVVEGGPPEQARPVIRSLAAQGFVLLRNEVVDSAPMLPIDPKVAKLAVIGDSAMVPAVQGGGSSHVSPPHVITPLEGLRAALPEADVVYQRGVRHRRLLDVVPRAEIFDPAGEGDGIRVEYLDGAGQVLSSELRGTERLVWLGGLPSGTKSLRLRGNLVAEVGEHVFGVNGTGHFRVEVSGREVLAADVTSVDGIDDPLGDMVEPPEQRFDVVLVESDLDGTGRAALTVEFTPQSLDMLVAVGIGHRTQEWDDASQLAAALAVARESDVAVVVVGTNDEVESEGRDRTSLDLPGAQNELVRRVAAVNPRTVVVVNAASPVVMPWVGEVPAVLWTWFGSQEYGDALADVLLGLVEPGGRLPTTFPAELADVPVPLPAVQPVDGELHYSEGSLIGYRAYADRGVRPAFHFGHGLGYTTWDYVEAVADGDVVRVKLCNTGDRPGREVVQVYAVEPFRLAGFAVVAAEAGAEVSVVVDVEPGGEFVVGRSAGDLRISATGTS
ncbi:glycoside hydrolase family 3 C-terminal domain-containing protein [Saccharopolyspora sp. K220]|uniref:glycoside hydrolase family 3 protein n=1 Tax=Saccharopolyspora soli TaxID=2926618 RepID=UPI001F5A9FE9|nr:glycoside hydrolase family 3 protein [Saccharopolyspora soli]MCI2416106.1 glycoside hydrolase family 3 C-terminal domain-containing protein [Saccharopolyspora soli]